MRYAGTGFSEAVAETLRERLNKLRAGRCILQGLKVSGAVWLEPSLHAEIAYRGVTAAGELQHASFRGLAD